MYLTLAIYFLLTFTPATPTEFPKYTQALQQAEKEHRPLLVIVSAKWCAPCQLMKRETIVPMHEANELERAVVTIVDIDEQPELAHQLMDVDTLPQVVLFVKPRTAWQKFRLIGKQNRTRILELFQKAKQ